MRCKIAESNPLLFVGFNEEIVERIRSENMRVQIISRKDFLIIIKKNPQRTYARTSKKK